MTDSVRIETRDRILCLELNRPEKKNALTVEMYAALTAALSGIDQEIRVVLLAGAGDTFSAGNDLRDFLERPPLDETSPVYRFLETLTAVPVPVIAAVRGAAIGIGTTMLLHCDLVYAGRGARFQLPFTSLALVPEAASTLLLPRRIGYARAAGMLLMGETLTAGEAHAAGLVTALFDDDDLEDESLAQATRLSALPPESVRATKALMRDAERRAVREQMSAEAVQFAERLRSEETREVLRKFFER